MQYRIRTNQFEESCGSILGSDFSFLRALFAARGCRPELVAEEGTGSSGAAEYCSSRRMKWDLRSAPSARSRSDSGTCRCAASSSSSEPPAERSRRRFFDDFLVFVALLEEVVELSPVMWERERWCSFTALKSWTTPFVATRAKWRSLSRALTWRSVCRMQELQSGPQCAIISHLAERLGLEFFSAIDKDCKTRLRIEYDHQYSNDIIA